MKLKSILKKHSGRSSSGKVTVRHQGARSKRFFREVDFKRNKEGVGGIVLQIEYDPNRNADVALVLYEDGERRYIISPVGLAIGSKIIASEAAPIEAGNSLPLKAIPVGTQVHSIEITKGKGGQIVKGAGCAAVIFGRDEKWVLVKLPSGEIRRFNPECFATVGQVGNVDDKNKILGKAGRSRRMGIRPSVRGVAMNPHAHPHGGGEGRSGVALKFQKTFYGRKAVGNTRRKNKYSSKLIIQGRKRKATKA